MTVGANTTAHVFGMVLLLIIIIAYLYAYPKGSVLGIDNWYEPPLFWDYRIDPNQNSKHLFDFYSLTHINHGLFFALVSTLLFPNMSVINRFYLVMGVELIFEIIENTNFVINRYRVDKKNRLYTGDSMANIIGDLLICALGFLLFVYLDSNVKVLFAIIIIEVLLWLIFSDSMFMSFLSAFFPISSK